MRSFPSESLIISNVPKIVLTKEIIGLSFWYFVILWDNLQYVAKSVSVEIK